MPEICPQCIDNHWFSETGIRQYEREIHEEAVKEANQYAKAKASTDKKTGVSLSWNKLWTIHFTEKYESLVVEKRNKKNQEYQTACYKKRYGIREKDICGYHGEFRC